MTADELFQQWQHKAERLVRQVKDESVESAIIVVITAFLDIHTTAQRETIADLSPGRGVGDPS
jgi:hypothetical protein